jgi:SAM-dependent methyltransferase
MEREILRELFEGIPRHNPQRLLYTRKAFMMLPKMDSPRILDIGCGTGEPTMELARLSGGKVFGIEVDQRSLDRLKQKIKTHSLSEHVTILKCSMFDMHFPDESFDILWSEGSISVIGFERGLTEWKRFIKPEGFLVIHEMTWLRPDPPEELYDYWKNRYPGICTIEENIDIISSCHYELVGHFGLPENVWWVDYYHPLERRIEELKKKYEGDSDALSIVESQQHEVELYKEHSQWYGSAFFVLQKPRS